MPDARCIRGLACKLRKKNAHEHTGQRRRSDISPRNGFTAYSALSLATGLFATIIGAMRSIVANLTRNSS
jgi:hypothetical protein